MAIPKKLRRVEDVFLDLEAPLRKVEVFDALCRISNVAPDIRRDSRIRQMLQPARVSELEAWVRETWKKGKTAVCDSCGERKPLDKESDICRPCFKESAERDGSWEQDAEEEDASDSENE